MTPKQREAALRLASTTPIMREPVQGPVADSKRSEAYDLIDRFLRNNLHDDDYAEYSAALDAIYTHPPQRAPLTADQIDRAWHDAARSKITPTMTEFARAIEEAIWKKV